MDIDSPLSQHHFEQLDKVLDITPGYPLRQPPSKRGTKIQTLPLNDPLRSSSISLVQFRAFNSREITEEGGGMGAAVREEERQESQEQLLIDDSFFVDTQEEDAKNKKESVVKKHVQASPKGGKRGKKGKKKGNKTYM